MNIPKRIKIEIKNKDDIKAKKEIILGLKIYNDDESWHNLSPLKTDKNGKLIIKQKQIIDILFDVQDKRNFIPKKVEIEIWNCEVVNSILNSITSMKSVSKKDIKIDLQKRGLDDDLIEKHSENSFQKLKEDIDIWSVFFNNDNCNTSFINHLISDKWKNDEDKLYKFYIKK